MPPDQLLALIVFALVASFTPGPNNTIATVTAANFGFRATLPHLFGVPLGFASMLVAGAGGVAALVLTYPGVAQALKWGGIGYLLWLAWQLARPNRLPANAGGPFRLPLGFAQSALFQYVNPKAWMFAMATTTAYVAGDRPLARAATVVVVCGVCAMLSLLTWSWLGAALRHWLTVGERLRAFNLLMALALAATAVWMGWSA